MLRIHSSVRMVMCPKGAFTFGLQYIQSHIAINDAFLMFAGLPRKSIKACNAAPWQISELKRRGDSVRESVCSGVLIVPCYYYVFFCSSSVPTVQYMRARGTPGLTCQAGTGWAVVCPAIFKVNAQVINLYVS